MFGDEKGKWAGEVGVCLRFLKAVQKGGGAEEKYKVEKKKWVEKEKCCQRLGWKEGVRPELSTMLRDRQNTIIKHQRSSLPSNSRIVGDLTELCIETMLLFQQQRSRVRGSVEEGRDYSDL